MHANRPAIRPASVEDAASIAEVHIRSWQWAYRGLLPDDFLDRLHETLDRRRELWTRIIGGEPGSQRTWVVEEADRILGFASDGPSRDEDASPGTGEIGGIYLLPEAVGKGIGRDLFARASDDLRALGFEEATLWVLETNARARRFYEAAGWRPDGATKVEERPRVILDEVRYRARL